MVANEDVKKTLNALAERRVVESGKTSSGWYRKWSDGFLEQGGTVPTTTNAEISVTLNKSFTTTKYNLQLCGFGDNWVSGWGIRQKSKSLSYFVFYIDTPGGATGITQADWYASGY